MYVILDVERECFWCIMRALKNGSRIACVRRAVVSNELFHPRFHLSTMMRFLNVLTYKCVRTAACMKIRARTRGLWEPSI